MKVFSSSSYFFIFLLTLSFGGGFFVPLSRSGDVAFAQTFSSSPSVSRNAGPNAGQNSANSSQSIEDILNNAKRALNGGRVQQGRGAENEGGSSSRSTRKSARSAEAAKTSKAQSEAPQPPPLVETQPLPADQAQSILKMDLNSIAHERQPKDPQFVAYIGFGQMSAHPGVTLTKDDDNFALDKTSGLSGGELQLKTSWQLVRFSNERFGLHFLVRGSGGVYGGDAVVDRTGVQNESRSYTYRVSPFALALGPELEFERRFHFGATVGPTMDLVSISGGGQTDTLTQVFTGDRLQLSLGATFFQNWDAEVSFFQNGIFNHNITDNGVLLAIGYAISG